MTLFGFGTVAPMNFYFCGNSVTVPLFGNMSVIVLFRDEQRHLDNTMNTAQFPETHENSSQECLNLKFDLANIFYF